MSLIVLAETPNSAASCCCVTSQYSYRSRISRTFESVSFLAGTGRYSSP
jgi:hypothetical protein